MRSENTGDVLPRFEDYLLQELERSPLTVRSYVQQLTAVARMLDKSITNITVRDVRYAVKRDTDVTRSTRQLRVAAFKQFHGWGLVESEPWADPAMLAVRSVRELQRLPRAPLSLDHARRAIAACRLPSQYRAVYFGLFAGLRIGESASITSANVMADNVLVLVGKGDKERRVPIHPQLRHQLPMILSFEPKSVGSLANSFKRLAREIGLSDTHGSPATAHTLRRTFATFLYDQLDVRREVIKALLGHGAEVTDAYAPVTVRRMREVVEQIDYEIGMPKQMRLF